MKKTISVLAKEAKGVVLDKKLLSVIKRLQKNERAYMFLSKAEQLELEKASEQKTLILVTSPNSCYHFDAGANFNDTDVYRVSKKHRPEIKHHLTLNKQGYLVFNGHYASLCVNIVKFQCFQWEDGERSRFCLWRPKDNEHANYVIFNGQ